MLWKMYLATGARRGELLGATWADVDLDASTLKIMRSLTPVGRKASITELKTGSSSRRKIALDEDTATALRQHRKLQAQQRLLMGGLAGQRPDLSE